MMRAIEPVSGGQLRLHGFEISYEVFGSADAPAILLLPAWQIVHSRIWKMQVPFLQRSYRVVTFDPPGNGGGERTTDPAAFEYDRIVDQAIGLLDHLGIATASVIGFSRGCDYGIVMAARYPERVNGLILIANTVSAEWRAAPSAEFWQRRETYSGWQRFNAHYWRDQYRDWLQYFFQEIVPEPHSTKAIEDGIAWGTETTPEILLQTVSSPTLLPAMSAAEAVARVRCPVLLIHGDDDRRASIERSQYLVSQRPDWSLVTMQGCGHGVPVRHPVRTNLLIRDFLAGSAPSIASEAATVDQAGSATHARA